MLNFRYLQYGPGKKIMNNKNVVDSNYHWKYFEKRDSKVKKHLHLTLMTTIHNFTRLFFTHCLFDASKISDFWSLTVFY